MAEHTDPLGSQQLSHHWNFSRDSNPSDFSFFSSIEDDTYFQLQDAGPSTNLTTNQHFKSSPQRLSTTFGMGERSSAVNVSTEASQLSGATTGLKCQVVGCMENREFSTESAFRKHQDKHEKPYTCTVAECKRPRFSDKGGLDRHKREVHGPRTYRCPITSCKGHSKGFARKYNLYEHQKRCHPGPPSSSARGGAQAPRNLVRVDSIELDHTARVRDEGGASSPSTMLIDDVVDARTGGLREKISQLLAVRAEIDRDIEALKRTVDILDNASH